MLRVRRATTPEAVKTDNSFVYSMNRAWTMVPRILLAGASLALILPAAARAQSSSDGKAAAVVAAMTQAEKMQIVMSWSTGPDKAKGYEPPADAIAGSAGFVPGIPRLNLPPQWATDSGIGVSGIGPAAEKRGRTALPSNLAVAATWNPELASRGAAMIGGEARASGYNIMLAGSAVLIRDPRGGRNFENAGEDPLLNGVMTGAQIRGVQSQHIISTLKHYALNAQETGRMVADARIDDGAARISDYLAVQIALERSRPGAVMCSYNKVNGVHSCENPSLLSDLLKKQWGFRGFVMSDWGAVHSTVQAANAGLDQQSGWPFDEAKYFGAPLINAVAQGKVPQSRLDDMARRIVRSLFAAGVVDHPVKPNGVIDLAKDAQISGSVAQEAITLLKNKGDVLPLAASASSIAVIGGHADVGVLSGGGSGQVHPVGGNAVPGIAPTTWPGPVIYLPSSPLKALRARAPSSRIDYTDGTDIAKAVALARNSKVAIIFATQWTAETLDGDLNLDGNQNALIAAVAAANPNTVVVLESNGAVLMPWIDAVPAIVASWYPGSGGGDAIARVLVGEVNPSGKLPVTFPASVAQLPRQQIDGKGLPEKTPFAIEYSEGAAVGYKWHERTNAKPLFPFGHGLSYTRFDHINLSVRTGDTIRVTSTVRNSGKRAGQVVVQYYASPVAGGWEAPKRLVGWAKVMLKPGESRIVSAKVDPRLLANWNGAGNTWEITGGSYRFMAGSSSADLPLSRTLVLPALYLPADFVGPDALPNS